MGPPTLVKSEVCVDENVENVENSAPAANQTFEVGACINVSRAKPWLNGGLHFLSLKSEKPRPYFLTSPTMPDTHCSILMIFQLVSRLIEF